MITTQTKLEKLADRIERAYRLRFPNWPATGLTPGVWAAAAARLTEAAWGTRSLPIDPELFVAAQSYRSFRRDPWAELAQEGSGKAYRSAIRQVVGQLRDELKRELRWSNRFLRTGGSLEELLSTPQSRVSPLTAMSLFIRHDRFDLVRQVRPAAESQHRACPLYRYACKRTIPADLYPATLPDVAATVGITDQQLAFAWN